MASWSTFIFKSVDAVNEIGLLVSPVIRLIAQSHITFLMRMAEFVW